MRGKKENYMETSWVEIETSFFSQDSVSLVLLLLRDTAQSYSTIKPLMNPYGVLYLPHVMVPNGCSVPTLYFPRVFCRLGSAVD